jgi:DNA-binding NarL/FixJ family response regulator
VLVVDDHAGFRATARRLLERDGWTVVGEAVDGASALAAAAVLAPDLILLDVGLPDIDGFVVAQSLADNTADRSRGPAVILVSSRDRRTYGARVDASPALGFVAKDELDGSRLLAIMGADGAR